MRVEVLLVANDADLTDSLLNVRGAGWEHYSLPFLPWTLRGSAAGVVALEEAELGSTLALRFSVSAQDGHVDEFQASMIVNTARPSTTAGVPVRVPFAVPFTTVVHAPCVVNVTVSGAAEEVTVSFAVHDPIPDAPPEPRR